MTVEQILDGIVLSLKLTRSEYFKAYIMQSRSKCPYCNKFNKHGENLPNAGIIFKHSKSVNCLACGDPYYLSFAYEQ